jgi:hypothetical protein
MLPLSNAILIQMTQPNAIQISGEADGILIMRILFFFAEGVDVYNQEKFDKH